MMAISMFSMVSIDRNVAIKKNRYARRYWGWSPKFSGSNIPKASMY